MYRLNGENSVTRLSDGACIPFVNGNRDYEEYKQWVDNGGVTAPEFTDADLLKKYESDVILEVQKHLDNSAMNKGYDDIKSAALRAGLPDSPFHSEGVAFGTWMDNCWAYTYKVKADVNAKKRTAPTVEELIAELPELVLP